MNIVKQEELVYEKYTENKSESIVIKGVLLKNVYFLLKETKEKNAFFFSSTIE